MPSFATTDLPKPKSWEEFENIVADAIKLVWGDNLATRNGRLGQKQEGIDIYGKPIFLKGGYAGVQCKDSQISIKDIEEMINLAEKFKPALKDFIIATSSSHDSKIQEEVRLIDEKRTASGKFGIRILFWEDICLKLAESDDLMVKHFPQFVIRHSSLENIKKRIMESEPNDWNVSGDLKIYTYKKDAQLFIKAEPFEQSHEFQGEWLKNFPDQHGTTDHYLVFYGNSEIDKLWAVSVDGGRCTIPYPHSINNSITSYQYKLGKIINDLIYSRMMPFGFDSYLRRAGIFVIEEEESNS